MADVLNSLYFTPSHVTARYDVVGIERTANQISTHLRNFKSNQWKGKVSKQSLRKIRLAVQWLVFMADEKEVVDPATGKKVLYRAGVLTLNLPTGCEDVTADFFRDILLPSFFSSAKYFFGLENYIWKIEAQKRGALHAHITIDKFLPWQWVQDQWCKILEKHGLLESYRSRFGRMSAGEYVQHRKETDLPKYRKLFPDQATYEKHLITCYRKGKEQKWSKPNCTDIHSVRRVRNLAGYLSKYLSKDPGFGPKFKGRFWACSHKLSKLRSARVNLEDVGLLDACQDMDKSSSGYKDIIYWQRSTGEPRFLGAVYFLERSMKKILQVPILRQLYYEIKEFYARSDADALPVFGYRNKQLFKYQPLTI